MTAPVPDASNGEPCIRLAREEDAAALAELAERTFRDTFGHLNRAGDMETHCHNAYGRDIQAAEIAEAGRATLLCLVDGRLAGYGQLRWNTGPTCVIARRPAEIQRFYIDAPWHGKGVAQRMMDALLENAEATGADVVWLGVWERNPRAIAFYRKYGFDIVGDHTFMLGSDPQRDLVLARPVVLPPRPAPGPDASPRPGAGSRQ